MVLCLLLPLPHTSQNNGNFFVFHVGIPLQEGALNWAKWTPIEPYFTTFRLGSYLLTSYSVTVISRSWQSTRLISHFAEWFLVYDSTVRKTAKTSVVTLFTGPGVSPAVCIVLSSENILFHVSLARHYVDFG